MSAIASLFAKSVATSKRRPKDVRLDTKCGKILNRTEFQEALVKKAADMKAKRALKTINRNVVSAKKAAIVKNDKTKPKKRV